MLLIAKGVAGSAAARLFGDALARRPLGTIWGHASSWDFRILEADHTADNVLITPGLRVLDCDRRLAVIDPAQFFDDSSCYPGGQYFDHWYYVTRDGEDRPYKRFNGERLTTNLEAR
jgi:hypothetical protein